MLAQCNDEGKENALYFINQTMMVAEVNYLSIKKICLGFFRSKITTLPYIPPDHFDLKGRSVKVYII